MVRGTTIFPRPLVTISNNELIVLLIIIIINELIETSIGFVVFFPTIAIPVHIVYCTVKKKLLAFMFV